ncbi:5-oxoprolinase subunit PxpA [Clostridium sp. MCC353]|uniref:LamB/YcsF family protein n=1 Tax=Clostridium sp. MCC353 TaxID=2592646 RepID=UPI001C02A0F0|nr:5-oxoprolinase subunit PxpA [Clostridium sp. MCC353]MBT9777395.1 5-oxoprolinase subunit PxpA [Clostridium sp. MCC353]
MNKIDLNCDLGESFGRYSLGLDEEVIPFVSSVNIACGFHASDPQVMERTVKLAKKYGAGIGAHPGFPDLMGFGRREMDVTPEEVKAYMTYQLGALYGFCRSAGAPMVHVKPHGALYNMAGRDYRLAKAVCEAVYAFDPELKLLALAGSQMVKAAWDTGLFCAQEVFADRAYEEDGSLADRRKPGAVIEDEELAVRRVIRMVKEGKTEAYTGKEISIKPDSVCVHGDSLKALDFVVRIRKALEAAGVEVAAF